MPQRPSAITIEPLNPVVGAELLLIAWIRKRFQNVSFRVSLLQVTLGGITVAAVGVAVGHA